MAFGAVLSWILVCWSWLAATSFAGSLSWPSAVIDMSDSSRPLQLPLTTRFVRIERCGGKPGSSSKTKVGPHRSKCDVISSMRLNVIHVFVFKFHSWLNKMKNAKYDDNLLFFLLLNNCQQLRAWWDSQLSLLHLSCAGETYCTDHKFSGKQSRPSSDRFKEQSDQGLHC